MAVGVMLGSTECAALRRVAVLKMAILVTKKALSASRRATASEARSTHK